MSLSILKLPLYLLTAIIISVGANTPASAEETARAVTASGQFRLNPKSPAGLKKLLAYSPETLPIISAHRGGPTKGYPENCIATFENTLRHTYATLEIDPRFTKDGAIVVHHDPNLDRTTTGTGPLAQKTLAELKALRLKDTAGNVTDFQIPTLDEVLEWARGRAILVLDQKDVPVAARVKKVEEHQAESYAMLIVYNYADAKTCYALNDKIMMEVMVPNQKQFAEFEKTGVPWSNLVAFVGHTLPEDKQLFERIHAKGALCMAGSSRNLDRERITGKVKNIAELEIGYRAMLERGVNLIETDLPVEVGELLYKKCPIPKGKEEFFSRE